MDGTESHTFASLPPGVERIHAAPEFKPDVDPFLLKKLDDGTRYQVETQSVIKQDVRWLKEQLVMTNKLAIESYLETRDMNTIRESVRAATKTMGAMKTAPTRVLYWIIGIAFHTMVTCIVTIWLTGFFKGSGP